MAMKRILILALAALIPAAVFAQSYDEDAVYSSENGAFTFDILGDIGYGEHLVWTDSYDNSTAGEFFLNVLKLKLYPVDNFGIEIRANWKLDHFASKKNVFELDADKKVQVYDFAEKFGTAIKRPRSWMHVNSFTLPVLLKIGGDAFSIGLGAEGSYNYRGTAVYKFKGEDKRHKEKTVGMAINPFTYNFLATITFDGTTIYGKYYPKSSPVLVDGSGVEMGYFTIGVSYEL